MSTLTSLDHLVKRHQTAVVTSSPEYKANLEEWQGLIEQLQERLQEATNEGKEKHIALHKKRGQLPARERIELLLDEDSPFLELCALAGYDQDDMTLGGSIVAGIGLVSGVLCIVSSNVPTMAGGAMNEAGVLKAGRIHQIAMQNRLPTITLTQSAGANLQQQFKVFHRGGAGFRNQALQSKAQIPSCCVVFGSSTAGGAYTPGMSDYVIMVKKKAAVYLGGPPLVQMATGEVTDSESLGGADMHSRVSGVSDQLANDEYDAIRKAREWMANLNWEQKGSLPLRHLKGEFEEPYYNPEELLGIVSANIRLPFDATEVIIRIVDGSRFTPFKPNYGGNLVCGWAFIQGIPVGILANNNVIFTQEANKATQFIQLCNIKNTPLIYLQNITGFMVGKQYEEEGIIKAGSRFINAVSNSTVPAITIMMGASYGAGNYAMCGRAYEPRFLFSWPNSKCSVMGPEQLTGVLDIVMRQGAARAGKKIDEEMASQRKALFQASVEAESDVYYTSSRILDDGIIDPRDTRTVIGFCLDAIYSNTVEGGNIYGVSRM
ncbi:Putative Propionyl-CoA carboxylase beta chain [Lichtheimia ramosa]|uniref:methylcrotonoyl-CoA carboxylase n=1 Tax=Lichtheimia ramosa TaxID=688394 RepID=A0A077W8V1_9FUNG|nr:Putative Propionyl-CoA carboxylase beta chain [Lichtheimia ramosa]